MPCTTLPPILYANGQTAAGLHGPRRPDNLLLAVAGVTRPGGTAFLASRTIMSQTNPATAKPKSIWDNDLPAGDSPPLPRWPLVFWIVVYVLWMLFLISMLIVRLKTA